MEPGGSARRVNTGELAQTFTRERFTLTSNTITEVCIQEERVRFLSNNPNNKQEKGVHFSSNRPQAVFRFCLWNLFTWKVESHLRRCSCS
mmetsp:Transcript_37500/g.73815  ORF Transcript_37500/g.73815 Transcript_37500/m.73815 type:complete len:90 (-) Transcript_37500:606-875(-)